MKREGGAGEWLPPGWDSANYLKNKEIFHNKRSLATVLLFVFEPSLFFQLNVFNFYVLFYDECLRSYDGERVD